jgi:membrane protein DedA with SNARE-associated domain
MRENFSSALQSLKENWKLNLARVAIVVGVVAISIFVYSIRDQVETLQQFGYPGIFVINLLGSATVILPAPALGLVIAAAVLKTSAGEFVFNPIWLGFAAGLGAALGELSGYGLGFSGQGILERTPLYDKLHDFTKRYGIITIFVLSIQPLPIFDLAGVAAGSLKMPVWQFLLATFAGKLIKMWLFIYAAINGVDWLTQFF